MAKQRHRLQAGDRFGQWTVLGGRRYDPASQEVFWACRCACGVEREVRLWGLVSGRSRNCGSGVHRRVHGGAGTRLFRIWVGMRNRVNCPKSEAYRNYGGRGIRICPEWQDDFAAFQAWALGHGYRDDLTIDRTNVDGHYEPANCRWIPLADQGANRRHTPRLAAFGEVKSYRGWARDGRCAVAHDTLRQRVEKLGWDPHRALTVPSQRG